MLNQKTIVLSTNQKKNPQPVTLQATKVVEGTLAMKGPNQVQLTVEFDPQETLLHECNFWVLPWKVGIGVPAPSVGVIPNGNSPILVCSDCFS
jgi:hypothetical protein